MTNLEKNIETLRRQYLPSKSRWYAGLGSRQQMAWDAIDGPDRADAEKVLWSPGGLRSALDDLEPFPGSDVSECLHYCVRYLGGISWGLWALAAMVRPEADARLCKKAVARAGLVPFPSCSYVERRSADYEEGVKALHKLWERDGCPDLDRWCRLATVKHGLHLIDAIISALR